MSSLLVGRSSPKEGRWSFEQSMGGRIMRESTILDQRSRVITLEWFSRKRWTGFRTSWMRLRYPLFCDDDKGVVIPNDCLILCCCFLMHHQDCLGFIGDKDYPDVPLPSITIGLCLAELAYEVRQELLSEEVGVLFAVASSVVSIYRPRRWPNEGGSIRRRV